MAFAYLFTFWKKFVHKFFVKPGNDDRKHFSIASSRVDLVGDPSEKWWNWAMSFFVVLVRMMALHAGNSDVGVCHRSLRLTTYYLVLFSARR